MMIWVEFILCLLFTICVHELAHLIVAVKCGVRVKIFSIGFWKPYIHKMFKGIDFRLTPWIVGGYCEISGMESKKNPDDFLAQKYYKKFLILVAGVTVNFLIACVCYLINYGSISIGMYVDWVLIKSIFTGSELEVYWVLSTFAPETSFALIQLSMLNLFCAVGNLLPIIPLDGGLIWYYIVESKLPKIVKKILFKGGWILVMGGQLLLILWVYLR